MVLRRYAWARGYRVLTTVFEGGHPLGHYDWTVGRRRHSPCFRPSARDSLVNSVSASLVTPNGEFPCCDWSRG